MIAKIINSVPMAFPTDFPMVDPMPGYFIYRDTPPGQPYDPAAPPVYFPPKDSDELFDALRVAFPHVKSHTERMRDAMIKFLIEERQAEQLQSSVNILPGAAAPSPSQQSWPSMSSSGSTSTFSSPETLDLATPTFGTSPQPHVPQLSRQFSTAPSITTSSSGEPSPPALEDMTGVFSVSTTYQPKQRIKRKMTEAEKAEYRKRRIVKACDNCAKRKRKCNHNQPEMETLAPKQKITKARTTPPAAKSANAASAQQVHQALMNFDNFTFDDSFTTDMQLFDDFTNGFEDPMIQYDYDQQRQFDHMTGMNFMAGGRQQDNRVELAHRTTTAQNQWRWDDRQDDSIPAPSPRGDLTSPAGMRHTTAGRNLQTATSANSASSNEALRLDQIAQPQMEPDHLRPGRHPHRLFSTINTRGGPQALPPSGDQGGSGNGMLWEHLRTGQVSPTYTLHVHDAAGHSSYESDGHGPGGIRRAPARSTLSATVLQLSGTTKAIRAFGRLPKSNGPNRISLQLISMASVVSAIAQSHAFGHTDQHMLARSGKIATRQAPTRVLDRGGELNGVEHPEGNFRRKQHLLDMFACNDPKACHPQSLPEFDAVGRDMHLERLIHDGPLEAFRIGDYLRMKTNFDDMDHQMGCGRQALPSCIADTQKRWTTSSEASTESKILASTSVPVSGGTLFEGESAAREGRPAFTLGEGIAKAASPSTELYMLKRRIPKALHRIVERENNAVPTPLLQTEMEREQYHEVAASRGGIPANTSNSQANGGAYPRLDVDSHVGPILGNTITGDRAIDRWLDKAGTGRHIQAVQTSQATQQTAVRPFSAPAPPTDTSPTILARATNIADAQNKALQVLPAGMRSSGSECDVYVHRKRSTFRNKDHFGRSSEDTPYWSPHSSTSDFESALAVLGGMLVLTTLFPAANATVYATTLFLLALASHPDQGTKASPFAFFHRAWSYYYGLFGPMWFNAAWSGASGDGEGGKLPGPKGGGVEGCVGRFYGGLLETSL